MNKHRTKHRQRELDALRARRKARKAHKDLTTAARKPGGVVVSVFPNCFSVGRIKVRAGSNRAGAWEKREFLPPEEYDSHAKPKDWKWPKIVPPWKVRGKKVST